jgi:hypothetical protein
LNLDDIIKARIMPATTTVLFRNLSLKWPKELCNSFNGDWILMFLISQNRQIGFIKDITAVYRSSVGVISKTDNIFKFKVGLRTNIILNKLTNKKYDYRLGLFSIIHLNSEIYKEYLIKEKKILSLFYFLKVFVISISHFNIRILFTIENRSNIKFFIKNFFIVKWKN